MVAGSTRLQRAPTPQNIAERTKMETLVPLGWSGGVGKGLKTSLHNPKDS